MVRKDFEDETIGRGIQREQVIGGPTGNKAFKLSIIYYLRDDILGIQIVDLEAAKTTTPVPEKTPYERHDSFPSRKIIHRST